VSQHIAEAEVGRLEALVADDPGVSAFPALAEARRRAGRAGAAEEVARAGLARRPDALAGRVALGLALLDQGRLDEARAELERVLCAVPDHPLAAAALEASGAGRSPWGQPPPPAPETADLLDIGEPEIDAAFDLASSVADELVTADSVAESALRAAELDGPEERAGDAQDALPVASRTLAGLLERQGHAADARTMRAALDEPSPGERERILATLERWLENLRRNPS